MYSTNKLFTAPPGRVFVEVDLSQIEVRVLACLSKDQHLINDMNNPEFDMHCKSAAFVLNCDYLQAYLGYKQKDPHYVNARKLGKTISFEMQYGAYPGSVSKRNGIDFKLVKSFYEAYNATYIGVTQFHNRNEVFVYQHNGVLKIPESFRYWTISKFNDGKYSRNQIMNYPIQGVSFDVNDIVWQQQFSSAILKHRQVHDAITFSIPEGDPESLGEIIEVYKDLPRRVSEELFDCSVALPFEIKTGKTLEFKR